MSGDEIYTPNKVVVSAKYLSSVELTAIVSLLIVLRDTTLSNKIYQQTGAVIAELTKR